MIESVNALKEEHQEWCGPLWEEECEQHRLLPTNTTTKTVVYGPCGLCGGNVRQACRPLECHHSFCYVCLYINARHTTSLDMRNLLVANAHTEEEIEERIRDILPRCPSCTLQYRSLVVDDRLDAPVAAPVPRVMDRQVFDLMWKRARDPRIWKQAIPLHIDFGSQLPLWSLEIGDSTLRDHLQKYPAFFEMLIFLYVEHLYDERRKSDVLLQIALERRFLLSRLPSASLPTEMQFVMKQEILNALFPLSASSVNQLVS